MNASLIVLSALLVFVAIYILFHKKKEEAEKKVVAPELEKQEEMNPTWDEVLKRVDLVGGEVESYEDFKIYRGPISGIENSDFCICIELAWVAERDGSDLAWMKDEIGEEKDPNTQKWRKNSDATIVKIYKGGMCQPGLRKDGSVVFSLFLSGYCILYPKGCRTLDPKLVEGLQISEVASSGGGDGS